MATPTGSAREYGWVKYVWLIYLSFFIVQPIQDYASWRVLLATGVGVAVFLYLYFAIFRTQGWRQQCCIGAIALLGFSYLPFNWGAMNFIIYAAAFIGIATGVLRGFIALAVLLTLTILEMELLNYPRNVEVSLLVIGGAIGLGNIYFGERSRTEARLRKADEEIKHLAKIAERERIARDLHDVLGHTLSLVVLKSELASKLIDSDPARAAREIRDVENVSRQALAEVRAAIRGYHAGHLASELTRAVDTLDTAGIAVETDWKDIVVQPAQESVLALALREGVLNVIRHSHARRCRLRLLAENGICSLEIQDDGRGAKGVEGDGLRGMRERVESIGGTLQKVVDKGTVLTVIVPIEARQS
jgi:two-component system sensor histidine kinase DesK